MEWKPREGFQIPSYIQQHYKLKKKQLSYRVMTQVLGSWIIKWKGGYTICYELKKHCMSYSLAVPGSRSVGKIEKACERQAGSGRQKERADLSLPLSDLARRPPLLRLSPLTVSLEHATYVEKTFFFFGLFLMKQKTWNYDGNSWNVSINDIRDFQTPFWLRCSGSNVLNVTSWKFTNGEAEFYCVSWAKCKKCLELRVRGDKILAGGTVG